MQRTIGRLDGKVAIVTGAGSSGPGVGTGKAMAILFARQGAKVLLVDQTVRQVEETLAAILEEGGEASLFQADVTRAGDCRDMVQLHRPGKHLHTYGGGRHDGGGAGIAQTVKCPGNRRNGMGRCMGSFVPGQ